MRKILLTTAVLALLPLAGPTVLAAATGDAGIAAGADAVVAVIGDNPAASPVADAAMNKDFDGLAALLAKKADVNVQQPDGSTALEWAVHWDNLDAAKALIKAGADVKSTTRLGATALYLAALNGNPEMVKVLLKAGADPNAAVLSHGEMPLMFAARSGNAAAVKALIDAGAKVDARENYRDTTALIWAAEQNHGEVVSLLLKNGADPSVSSKVVIPPARRKAPAKTDDKDAAKAGGAPAAEAAAPAAKAKAPAAVAAADGAKAAKADGDEDSASNARGGITALVAAARQDSMDAAKALIAGGANVDQQSADGSTALIVAIQNAHLDMANLLIAHGADVNISNKKGWNPLYLAVKDRSLEKGTMPNPTVDKEGMFKLISLIVEKGADVNARLKDDTEVHNSIRSTWLRETGATPFLRAAFSGDLPVMKLLMAHGADPKIATEDGTTSLMALAGVGFTKGFMEDFGGPEMSIEAMKMLLKTGIDINAKNTDDVTALHGAAHKNFVEAIELLVDNGADLKARSMRRGQFVRTDNFKGNTVLDWAVGVQTGMESAIYNTEAVDLVTKLMKERNIPVEMLETTAGGKVGS
jgi:ankyrin repeat protein